MSDLLSDGAAREGNVCDDIGHTTVRQEDRRGLYHLRAVGCHDFGDSSEGNLAAQWSVMNRVYMTSQRSPVCVCHMNNGLLLAER